MSFVTSLQSEILKTKRTASFWLTVIGAAFIPVILFLSYMSKPEKIIPRLHFAPWPLHFAQGWQPLSSFLLPMYIIIVCALIVQIEFKNNAWKQVFASPQTTAQVYFSKFVTVHLMVLFCYLLFNLFMIAVALGANLVHSKYEFLHSKIDWAGILRLNARTYVSILGISAIQFWLSLRFKNFIAPMGIGLALLISSLISIGFQWEEVYLLPYAHPMLTLQSIMKGK
ncbi:MAG: hypothetical protein JWP88_492, partial [Flaviaesturariibacter sp.]|nr:hypothetical protein [Flaviaesturariibacter sp.]